MATLAMGILPMALLTVGLYLLQAPQRAATTAFTRLRTYCDGGFSLLRATLVEGGRQHQIRRHLNSVAHQVLGVTPNPNPNPSPNPNPNPNPSPSPNPNQVVGDTQYGKSRINAMLQAIVSRAIVSRAIVSIVVVNQRGAAEVGSPVCLSICLPRYLSIY